MASIYQINEQINAIFERYQYVEDGKMIDTETGEIIEEETVLSQLDDLGIEKSVKLDSYAFKVKENKVIIESVAEEIKRLQAYKKSIERMSERLIEVLTFEHGGKTYKDKLGRYSVNFRKNKSVEITDEKKIPADFLTPQPPKISKTEIKKAIEAGAVVPGAEIIEKVSCSVR